MAPGKGPSIDFCPLQRVSSLRKVISNEGSGDGRKAEQLPADHAKKPSLSGSRHPTLGRLTWEFPKIRGSDIDPIHNCREFIRRHGPQLIATATWNLKGGPVYTTALC